MTDIRLALRALRRSPAFAVTAVVILALGSGVTGAVFSIVRGWLSIDRAIPNAHRLVAVARTTNGNANPTAYFDERSIDRLLELQFRSLSHLFAARPVPVILATDGNSLDMRMEAVTSGYFPALGVPPLLGRAFEPPDERPGGTIPVVLSEGVWIRIFESDPRVIGRTVRLSTQSATIVGVMPSAVRGFNVPTTTAVDVWAPLAAVKPLIDPSGKPVAAQVFGRIRDGATFEQARAEMQVTGTRFDPDQPGLAATLFPVERGALPRRVHTAMQVMGAGGVALSALVLLIACANLANLLLARSASRASDIAVRMALGASPSRILRQQLLETLCLTALGGAAGLVLVNWVSSALGRFTFVTGRGALGAGTLLVDGWLLAYFFALVAVTAAAIGILPALRAIRMDPGRVLGTSGRGGQVSGRFERKRTLLVASQVAASTVLLVMAGLFARSAVHASRYHVAFDAERVATGTVDFGGLSLDEVRGRQQQDVVLAIARSITGTAGSALATGLPAGGDGSRVSIERATDSGTAGFGAPCRLLSVSPGFVHAVGGLALRGRDFTSADTALTPGIAILNESAASLLWPGEDPIGRRFRIRKGPPVEVVGVTSDADRTEAERSGRCYVLVPLAQQYSSRFILAVSAPSDPKAMLRRIDASIRAALPGVSLSSVTTAEEHFTRTAGPARAVAFVLLGLSALGLTIAIVGLYGVMSYVVGLRRAEFGLRKVLGATDLQIYRMVTSEALRMLAFGIAAGIPAAYIVSRAAANALVGVKAHDPVTYALVPACLLVVGVLAAFRPAHSAARIDPAAALRDL